MKKLIQKLSQSVVLVGCLLISHSAISQNVTITDSAYHFDKKGASIHATDENLVQGIGWVRSPFGDNWYLQIQGGGQLYYGLEDRLGPWYSRLTFNGEVKLGRWVFPMLGYRLGAGYGYAHGFLSKETYEQYRNHIQTSTGHGQHEPYLSGYYWTYNNDLLIQKWKYYYLYPEIVINLSYAKEYDPHQPWMTWVYFGPSLYFGQSEGYIGPEGMVNPDVDPNRGAEVHLGLLEKFQVTPQLHMYFDLRASAMQRTFDREWVHGKETPLAVADLVLNAHVGVDYNFHFRSEAKRTEWYRNTIDSNATIANNIPRHIYTAQQVSIKVLNYMDTIFAYDTLDAFSAEYDSIMMHRARKRAQDAIDSMRLAFEQNCQEATLDDILGKHLLPYEMVFFELDKWNILPNEELKIAKMASIMRSFPDAKFLLIGSADSKTGTVKRNQFLSENRSDVVYERLVNVYGIDPSQLKQVYMGGILDFDPYQLNRATVIIMDHPKVMEEFQRLKAQRKAGGSTVEY